MTNFWRLIRYLVVGNCFDFRFSTSTITTMAPGKMGLSLEEKRKKMMEIFYETKDVFLLKDLEKIAPKMKGITSMSVKDVVTSLVDDGLVDTEKIGTSVYFWAFPSKASQARKRKLEMAEEKSLKVSESCEEVVYKRFA